MRRSLSAAFFQKCALTPDGELPVPNGNPHGQFHRPQVPRSISSARPPGSLLGSCRIVAGLSSRMAALRPLSSSRRSGASRARQRTPEEPRQTPRSGYRPCRRVEPPRRQIRRVGSYCGNLGPPSFSSVNGSVPATVGDHPTVRSRGDWRCDCSRPLEPYASR
jgi:hypothetical protein